MAEETITEVGNVRIIDDGYDDEDVFIEINDERAGSVKQFENIEAMAPEMSGDFQEAVAITREWYDNGRTHNNCDRVINFMDTVGGAIATLPLTADYNIENVEDDFTNEYVVYFDENDLLSDVITNRANDDTDFDQCWYFSEVEIEDN